MSAHSTMMGSQYKDNQSIAMSRKEGSMYSGRGSNFIRGQSFWGVGILNGIWNDICVALDCKPWHFKWHLWHWIESHCILKFTTISGTKFTPLDFLHNGPDKLECSSLVSYLAYFCVTLKLIRPIRTQFEVVWIKSLKMWWLKLV